MEKMRVLIIEDNEFKYGKIEKIIKRVAADVELTWAKSRNSGLINIFKHNVEDNDLAPFDMLICDNYLPIYDEEYGREEPYGEEIVREVRERFGLKDLPILMSSSEKLEQFDYDYSITYDSSVYMDPLFKEVFDEVRENRSKRLVKRKSN